MIGACDRISSGRLAGNSVAANVFVLLLIKADVSRDEGI